MPWNEVFLPRLDGSFRAVSVDNEDFAVWTEHGLFRYKLGPYSSVQAMYPDSAAAGKVNKSTGEVNWTSFRYRLVGDMYFVPAPPDDLIEANGPDGQALRREAREQRLHVVAGEEVRLSVDYFPRRGSRWFVATFLPCGHLLLADSGGVRVFQYTEVPGEKRTRWDNSGVRNQHASLLASILAEPDDDTLRMIYADFLEENGDLARAEFIRLQCRLAERMRKEPIPVNAPDARRAAQLESSHGADWLADLPRVRGVDFGRGWMGGAFWRGFATLRAESAPRLIQADKDMGGRTPLESAIISNLSTAGARSLTRSSLLARLRVLEVSFPYLFPSQTVTLEPLELLLSSPAVAGLRGLIINSGRVGTSNALASCPNLTGLEWLVYAGGVGGASLSDSDALALAESTCLPKLRWIILWAEYITETGIRTLRQRYTLEVK